VEEKTHTVYFFNHALPNPPYLPKCLKVSMCDPPRDSFQDSHNLSVRHLSVFISFGRVDFLHSLQKWCDVVVHVERSISIKLTSKRVFLIFYPRHSIRTGSDRKMKFRIPRERDGDDVSLVFGGFVVDR